MLHLVWGPVQGDRTPSRVLPQLLTGTNTPRKLVKVQVGRLALWGARWSLRLCILANFQVRPMRLVQDHSEHWSPEEFDFCFPFLLKWQPWASQDSKAPTPVNPRFPP